MKKLMTMARQFRDDENGAAMVEYSILLGLIAAATIAVVVVIAGWVGDQFAGLCVHLNGHGTNAAGTSTGTCTVP
ncbi:Flp family type IVb pilin [Mesorhizobium sp. B2-8-5]|uniref:Flp family type IVb pilin n=1 Tax=Mesorhizobium sp. B2-8-5 TaxID=2589903 RepID=UPI00112A1917|nr:Flp family type IVb pilin [Mesorhizobium sp. B2-8-5]UCI25783.1 Flp family type IVb pilin [Mesorhizobium sp. B2-8-5]